MKKKIGIYVIINKINGKRYIGQSVDINNRFIRHRYHLNKGIHANDHLQRAWDKYGSSNFEFKIIVECTKQELDLMEESQAHQVSNDLLYNITDDFTSRAGSRNPFFKRKHSAESKQKMSEAKKGVFCGVKNPNYGGKNKHILSKLMAGSKNCNATLNEQDVVEIKKKLNEGTSHQAIANEYGVSRTAITKIKNGHRWAHVEV